MAVPEFQYRPEIDGLRAIAVIPVILFHAGFSLFSGGFIGVDVFFVISGYLLTSIIVREREAGSFSFARFYERRARRILPVLLLILLSCIPFAWMSMLQTEFKAFASTLVSVLLFTSNVKMWHQSGYFETASELKPLLHTWSLAVEEQFYFIFPITLLVIWRLRRRSVVPIIGLVAVISFLLSEYLSRFYPSFNFYMLHTRAWELLAGSLCAFAIINPKPVRDNALSLIGLTFIIASVFWFDSNTRFPSAYSLLPVIGTILVLLFGVSSTATAKILSVKPVVGIGLISFSLYLWHQPIFAYSKLFALDPLSDQIKIAIIFLTLILSIFSWRYIEKRFRSASIIPARQFWVTISVSGAICLGLGLTTPYFYNKDIKIAHLNIKKLTPGAGPEIILLGDSHANHLFFGLKYIAGSQIKDLSSPGCIPFFGVDRFDSRFVAGTCEKKMRNALEIFERDDELRTIILTSMGPVYLDGTPFRDHGRERITGLGLTLSSEPSLVDRWEIFEKGLRSTLDRLSKNERKNIIFALDVPELGIDEHECSARAKSIDVFGTRFGIGDINFSKCTIPRVEFERRNNRYHSLVKRVLADYPRVSLFDPTDLFCNETVCKGALDGTALYRDPDHLSEFGSLYVANMLSKLVK